MMRTKRGFTLIELIVVIAIIVILTALVVLSTARWKSRAKLARISSELGAISTSVTQYAEDNNYTYPGEVSRSVPPGLEKYLAGGTWPESVYPNGVFDWDNLIHPVNGQRIYQITYRLCDTGDPASYCSDPVQFPNFTSNSGIFYCINGPCIPSTSDINAPAYCVNCADKTVNY